MPEEAKPIVRLGATAKEAVSERSKKGWVQAWKGLRKATSSVLIQLRTGRIGLNQYLTRINVRQDARSGCGLGNQNPRHVVMGCPLLGELRKDMWRDLWRRRVLGTLSFIQPI
jgi:hypothetical protein